MYATRNRDNNQRLNIKKTIINTSIVVAAAIVLFSAVRFANLDSAIKYLFPGNINETKQALNILIENLKMGVNVQDSVAAFCNEIINNAKINP